MFCPGQTENGDPFKETHIGAQPRLLPQWGETVYDGVTNGLTLSSYQPTIIISETNNCGTNSHSAYAYAHARWPEVCQYHTAAWRGLWWKFTVGRDYSTIPFETCERTYYATNVVGSEKVGGYYSVKMTSDGTCSQILGALTAQTVEEYRYNVYEFPKFVNPPKRQPWLEPSKQETPIRKVTAITMPNTAFTVQSASGLDALTWNNEGSFVTDANGIGGLTNLTNYGDASFYRVVCYTNSP